MSHEIYPDSEFATLTREDDRATVDDHARDVEFFGEATGRPEEFTTRDNLNFRVAGAGTERTIEGYVVRFNEPSEPLGRGDNLFIEECAPTCFDQSLRDIATGTLDFKMLWQHDLAIVLGSTSARTLEIWKDNVGLRFRVNPPNTQGGNDAITLVGRGDVRGVSWGFRSPISDTWTRRADGMRKRTLRSVNAFEASLTGFPAYSSSIAQLVQADPRGRSRMMLNEIEPAEAEIALSGIETPHTRRLNWLRRAEASIDTDRRQSIDRGVDRSRNMDMIDRELQLAEAEIALSGIETPHMSRLNWLRRAEASIDAERMNWLRRAEASIDAGRRQSIGRGVDGSRDMDMICRELQLMEAASQ